MFNGVYMLKSAWKSIYVPENMKKKEGGGRCVCPQKKYPTTSISNMAQHALCSTDLQFHP